MGEHLRNTSMDRGLPQREVTEEIGADPATDRNRELGRREPRLPHGPAIIEFLRFVPFEVGETLGERIRAWRKIHGVPRRSSSRRR